MLDPSDARVPTTRMVQAARSGKQDIAEGSQASGTSRKTELKLEHPLCAETSRVPTGHSSF